MKKLEELIQRLQQLADLEDHKNALEAAKELWQYPYDAQMTGRLREAYIRALFYVADYFQFVGKSSYGATAPLKRAYTLDNVFLAGLFRQGWAAESLESFGPGNQRVHDRLLSSLRDAENQGGLSSHRQKTLRWATCSSVLLGRLCIP